MSFWVANKSIPQGFESFLRQIIIFDGGDESRNGEFFVINIIVLKYFKSFAEGSWILFEVVVQKQLWIGFKIIAVLGFSRGLLWVHNYYYYDNY